jgi:CBS-domain-containing membrane protein
LGVMELIIALIWLIPRTGVVGTLLAVAYMGGAIAVHFINSQPVFTPVIIQVLIWIAAAVRFPELTKRLVNKI